jgi:hypothetical protein
MMKNLHKFCNKADIQISSGRLTIIMVICQMKTISKAHSGGRNVFPSTMNSKRFSNASQLLGIPYYFGMTYGTMEYH